MLGSAAYDHGWSKIWPNKVRRAIGQVLSAQTHPFAPTVGEPCASGARKAETSRVVEGAKSIWNANLRAVAPVDTAFSPLDRELKLERSGLTPHAHECLVRLGAWMPFAHAAEELEAILGVQVSQSTVRRLTEEAGKLCCHQQQELSAQASPQKTAAPAMAMSADGAMVHIRGNGWHEVKTLVIGQVKPVQATARKRDQQRRTSDHTVFSRLADAGMAAMDLVAESLQNDSCVELANVGALPQSRTHLR